MKKFLCKFLCLTFAMSAVLGAVACDKEEETSSPLASSSVEEEAPLGDAVTEEAWKTVTDAVVLTGKYEGSCSVNLAIENERKRSNGEIETSATTYEFSHNADTLEGYEIAIFDFEDGGSERTKIVRDGEFYYVYYVDNDDNGAITAEKYGAATFQTMDVMGRVYEMFEDMVYEAGIVRWGSQETKDGLQIKAPTYAEYKAAFEGLFGSNSDAKLTAYTNAGDNGELILTVEWTGYAVDEGETTKLYSKDVVTVKDGRVLSCVSEVDDGTEKQKQTMVFSNQFNQAGYDNFSLTGAPDKSEITEQPTTQSKKYSITKVIVVDDYVYSSGYSFNSSWTTYQQQVAGLLNSTSPYYDFSEYYIDEAMTVPLTENIAEADWLALDRVYVQATIKDQAVAIMAERKAQGPSVIPKEEWLWFVDAHRRGGGSTGYGDKIVSLGAYTLDAALIARGAKVYVNGQLYTDATLTVEGGRGYYVSYEFDDVIAQSLEEVGYYFINH